MAKKYEVKIKKLTEEIKNLENQREYHFNDIKNAPMDKQGIYILYSKKKEILYVGITQKRREGLRGRLKRHFSGKGTFARKIKKSREWIRKNCLFKFRVINSLRKRRILEHFTIAILNPKYND